MHSRLIVLTKEGRNSTEARRHVYDDLWEHGFAGRETRYESPIAGWFVIGGRWTGELKRAFLNKEERKALDRKLGKRNICRRHGYRDDAVKVAPTLWRKFLSRLTSTNDADICDGKCILDVDGDEVGLRQSKGKWAVVVDFHH